MRERGLVLRKGLFISASVVLAILILDGVAFSRSSPAIAAANSLCERNLPFGAPTTNAPTTIICHTGYVSAVDDASLVPRWVAYSLTAQHSLGCLPRPDNFHVDERLLGRRHQEPQDYLDSGYDKGHQAPAEDFAWSATEMSDSFSMANMAPQLPQLNRRGWEYLEEAVRSWALTRGKLEIYVGPVLAQSRRSIGKDHVVVPVAFWKVVIDPSRHEALAFIMPQAQVPKGNLGRWETSVLGVEQAAGVSLNLPAWVNRDLVPPGWKVNVAGLRKQRQVTCKAQ